MTSTQIPSVIRKAPQAIWTDKAKDFTSWLAENIAELNMKLGMPLKARSYEVPEGARYIDILATDTDSGRSVVIENQLENSAGDHLGRLLSYAASKDADIVIWVPREFEEKQRLTLEWLNKRTESQTRFFGIAVEDLSIEGSPPAPQFRVAVAPEDWRPAEKACYAVANKRREFWQALKCQMEQNDLKAEVSASKPDMDWEFTVDHTGGLRYTFFYRYISKKKNRVWLSFHLATYGPTGRSIEWCRESFDLLKKDMESIEATVGSALKWDREFKQGKHNPKTPMGSRIVIDYPYPIYNLKASSDDIRSWAVDKYRLFREAFEPYREQLDKLHSSED